MADDGQGPGGRKTPVATSTAAVRPLEQGLKCPRCDSPNTKFCYYNNYSLSQPRHFCKTCRRYWTKGGALRNVPVGGGCRKNKKSSKSTVAALSSSSRLPVVDPIISGFSGLPSSMAAAAMDFHIGLPPLSRLHAPAASGVVFNRNQFIASPSSAAALSAVNYNEIGNTASSSAANSSSIVSFIESLSSINQELHWKLQQQRMQQAILFEGELAHKESSISPLPTHNQQELIISTSEAAEFSIDEVCGSSSGSRNMGVTSGTNTSTACFLENSYTMPPSTTIINSSSNYRSAKRSTNVTASYWNEITAWNDMPQFTTLP